MNFSKFHSVRGKALIPSGDISAALISLSLSLTKKTPFSISLLHGNSQSTSKNEIERGGVNPWEANEFPPSIIRFQSSNLLMKLASLL